MENLNTIIFIVEVIAGISLAILYVKSRLPEQTISNYEKLAASQEKRIKDLEDSRDSNALAIAELQGQVNVYKDIPLKEIAVAIQGIVTTQEEIIKLIHRMNKK